MLQAGEGSRGANGNVGEVFLAGVADFDLVLATPPNERSIAVAVRYDRRMPAPFCRIGMDVSQDGLEKAWEDAGIPLVVFPDVITAMNRWVWPSMGEGPWPGWRETLARAMSRVHRVDPERYREKWGLERIQEQNVDVPLFLRWMLNDVPRADFVVLGEGQTAVAVLYDAFLMDEGRIHLPPRILAKGTGWIGRSIRAHAEEHGIPMVKNSRCTNLLFTRAVPSDFMPSECWDELRSVMEGLAEVNEALRSKWVPRNVL